MKVKTKYGEKILACLLPKNESGITCHEKTLCDCEVVELLQDLEVKLSRANGFVEQLRELAIDLWENNPSETDWLDVDRYHELIDKTETTRIVEKEVKGGNLAPYGDKESDALDGYEINRLKMKDPKGLLEKMLVGRTIVGVARIDDDEVSLIFQDGSSVAICARTFSEASCNLVVSKEMYVEKTVLETVEV